MAARRPGPPPGITRPPTALAGAAAAVSGYGAAYTVAMAQRSQSSCVSVIPAWFRCV